MSASGPGNRRRLGLGLLAAAALLPPFGGARWVRPGSVIVLHEGAGRGATTSDVLARVLPGLRARGYRVVTPGRLAEAGR